MSATTETYAALRQQGQILLPGVDGYQVPALRRLARKDGLQVTVYRRPSVRGVSPEQHRNRRYSVSLVHPSDPTTIVAPDADE